MSLFAKIGIIGVAVVALVIGGLYYIFFYARNGVKEATVTGVNKDQAISTNAIHDPSEPISTDTDGTVRYGGLSPPPVTGLWTGTVSPGRYEGSLGAQIVTAATLQAGGAQNNSSLPALTGSDVAYVTPARGLGTTQSTIGLTATEGNAIINAPVSYEGWTAGDLSRTDVITRADQYGIPIGAYNMRDPSGGSQVVYMYNQSGEMKNLDWVHPATIGRASEIWENTAGKMFSLFNPVITQIGKTPMTAEQLKAAGFSPVAWG